MIPLESATPLIFFPFSFREEKKKTQTSLFSLHVFIDSGRDQVKEKHSDLEIQLLRSMNFQIR
jgi:hypothetical protein